MRNCPKTGNVQPTTLHLREEQGSSDEDQLAGSLNPPLVSQLATSGAWEPIPSKGRTEDNSYTQKGQTSVLSRS